MRSPHLPGGRHALAPRQQAASSIFLDGSCIAAVRAIGVAAVLLLLFGCLDLLVVLLHLVRGRRDQVGRQPKQVDGRTDARRHDGALRGGAHVLFNAIQYRILGYRTSSSWLEWRRMRYRTRREYQKRRGIPGPVLPAGMTKNEMEREYECDCLPTQEIGASCGAGNPSANEPTQQRNVYFD